MVWYGNRITDSKHLLRQRITTLEQNAVFEESYRRGQTTCRNWATRLHQCDIRRSWSHGPWNLLL